MTILDVDLLNSTREGAAAPVRLAPSLRAAKDHPRDYLPEKGLADAMRVALLLRRPLLLTGEAGTGKTQAAHFMSWKLGYGEQALRFEAKSTSTARDLFYTFDTIGRFHAAQVKIAEVNEAEFITWNALGAAILRASRVDDVQQWLARDFEHTGEPTHSVVLIDEVDKAPRDFPNDVLTEIENMRFRVPEFRNREFAADPDFQPMVVITSNSEKNLPAPFLRRCVYYHIARPDRERFAQITKARLGVDVKSALMEDALNFLMYLRGDAADLTKKPATAELLDFVLALQARGAKPDQRFKAIPEIVISVLGTLVKDAGRDPEKLLQDWSTR